MKSWLKSAVILCVSAGLFLAVDPRLGLSETNKSASAGGVASDSGTVAGESLAFRLKDWKVMHFDDASKAAVHLATVQKLGCEAKQAAHSGHTDVSYRSAEWRDLQVADHQLADQWQGWLKAAGFDVSHAHTDRAFTAGPEAVKFRLSEWRRTHGTGATEDGRLIDTLKKLGCEVRSQSHGNHSDISYRAPTWRAIRLADDAMALQWRTWLKENGFEVAKATE